MTYKIGYNSPTFPNQIAVNEFGKETHTQDKFFPKNNQVSIKVGNNESPTEIHRRFLLKATSEAGLDGTKQQQEFVERYVNDPLDFASSKYDPTPNDGRAVKKGEIEKGTHSYTLNSEQVKYLKQLQDEYVAQGGKLSRGKDYSLPQSTNNSNSSANGSIQKINLRQLAEQAEVLTSNIGIPTDPNELKSFFVNLSNAPNMSKEDNALFSLIKSVYGGGNLTGNDFGEILSLAKDAGVKVQNLNLSGNSAKFDLSIADILRIKIARISVQEKVNRVEKVYRDAMDNNEISAFIRGVVKGGFNSVKGTIELITDLPGTMKALWQIVSNPVETFNALKDELGKTWQEFKDADSSKRSEMLGELVGSAIVEILLGKGIGKAGSILAKTKTGAELIEKAKLLKAATATKIAQKFSDEAAEIASQRIKQSLGNPKFYNGVAGADLLKDYAIVAGNRISSGTVKFADFAKKMIDDFGDKVKPHLEKLYRDQMIELGLSNKIDEVGIKGVRLDKIVPDSDSILYPPKATRNRKLAGKNHPVTGVYFDRNGYPVFSSKFDSKLPTELRGATVSDTKQFKEATRQLKRKIEENPALRREFTEQQLKDIFAEKDKIDNLTWHHHQDGVRLQLVDEWTHAKSGHDGGRKNTGGRP